MTAQTLLARTLRPVFRFPFPKRWSIFRMLVNNPEANAKWAGYPVRWTRSKTTGLEIPCDLSVFSGRIAWFFRRWYEIDTESVIMTLLGKGDVFLDIGGNVGMASLAARSVVGPEGQVYTFEPNPNVAAINREALRRNSITNVELREAAISDRPGIADLFVPFRNHGEATLGGKPDGAEGYKVEVQLVTGSQIADLDRIDLIKIDVEGHELTAMRALREVFEKQRPPVICELMGEHLLRSGSKPSEVLGLAHDANYRCFEMHGIADGLFRVRAILTALDDAPDGISCKILLVPAERAEEIVKLTFRSLPK